MVELVDFNIISSSYVRGRQSDSNDIKSNEKIKETLTNTWYYFEYDIVVLKPAENANIIFEISELSRFKVTTLKNLASTIYYSGGMYTVYFLENGIWKPITNDVATNFSDFRTIIPEMPPGRYMIKVTESIASKHVVFSEWRFEKIIPKFLIRKGNEIYTITDGEIIKVSDFTTENLATAFDTQPFLADALTQSVLIKMKELGKIKFLKKHF